MHESLLSQGYGEPIATPCAQEIDKMVKQGMKNSGSLLMSMRTLIDKILVFDVKDIAGTSTDYLGVLHIRLARGEMVMVVPWPHQYDEGGQLCLYPKGDVEVFEIELILVELIELLEMDQTRWM